MLIKDIMKKMYLLLRKMQAWGPALRLWLRRR